MTDFASMRSSRKLIRAISLPNLSGWISNFVVVTFSCIGTSIESQQPLGWCVWPANKVQNLLNSAMP